MVLIICCCLYLIVDCVCVVICGVWLSHPLQIPNHFFSPDGIDIVEVHQRDEIVCSGVNDSVQWCMIVLSLVLLLWLVFHSPL